MHIPDGFLNNQTTAVLIGAAVLTQIYAAKVVRKDFFEKIKYPALATPEGLTLGGGVTSRLTKLGQEKIFKMAVLGAFIFAGQMVNFPITHGTSGHLLGGLLAALLLGPWEGLLVISVILGVQSLFFADGGLLALGANIFNMGVVGTVGSYFLFRWLKRYGFQSWVAIFLVAWLSVVLASLACAVELAISGTVSLIQVLPAMFSIHTLIGLGEALITILVLRGLNYQPQNMVEKKDE